MDNGFEMYLRPMIYRDEAHGGPVYFDETLDGEVWLTMADAAEWAKGPEAAEFVVDLLGGPYENAIQFAVSFASDGGKATAKLIKGEAVRGS